MEEDEIIKLYSIYVEIIEATTSIGEPFFSESDSFYYLHCFSFLFDQTIYPKYLKAVNIVYLK